MPPKTKARPKPANGEASPIVDIEAQRARDRAEEDAIRAKAKKAAEEKGTASLLERQKADGGDEEARIEAALAEITAILQRSALRKLEDAGVDEKAILQYKGQAIRKNYLTAVEACRDFLSEDTKYDGSELDLGIATMSWDHNASASHRICIGLSLFISALFIVAALLYQQWAIAVRSINFFNASGLDLEDLELGLDLDPHKADHTHFDIAVFVGWPEHQTLKNLYAGTVLGLIFGFLDNFGLFYGMGALDSFFYWMGSNICAGIMAIFRRGGPDNVRASRVVQTAMGAATTPQDMDYVAVASDMHVVTTDLMAGLGNTFSDFLGVALGTAALQIAQAGLGVEPEFWPMDLISMVIGCLLGVFLPALIKHAKLLGGERNACTISMSAWTLILLLFGSVFLAGVPYEMGFVASASCLGTVVFAMLIGMCIFACTGASVVRKASEAVAGEISLARKR